MLFNKGYTAAGLAAAVGVTLVATAKPAGAAVTVGERSSVVEVSASAQGFVGGPASDSDRRSTTSPTDNFTSIVNALADTFIGSSAESVAQQNSSLTYTGGSLSRVEGSGSASITVFASGGGFAQAIATSDVRVVFTIPAGEVYDFTLSGDIAQPAARPAAVVYLRDLTRDTDVVDRSGDVGAFSVSGELRAGSYELNGRTFGIVGSTGAGDAQFTFDFALTPDAVPEPGSATLVAALPAALLVRRDRRRNRPRHA